jgi:murein DD-endopeptidase MepM/ murein hydrolase activator NlpD
MRKKKTTTVIRCSFGVLVVVALVGTYFAYPWLRTRIGRAKRLGEWLQDPSAHPTWALQLGTLCGSAPFRMPTSGYIGFIWGDSFQPGKKHQGIDIFGGTAPGQTPVVAAYSGFLTRLPDWKSTVIIRLPADPLRTDRQIWTYYTHMANANGASYVSPEFPPGTSDVFVAAGTFLGFQGDYSGNPNNPVGVHLHFSIIQDDGLGSFRNELKIENTLDPSPYLGLPLNASQNPNDAVTCVAESVSR